MLLQTLPQKIKKKVSCINTMKTDIKITTDACTHHPVKSKIAFSTG